MDANLRLDQIQTVGTAESYKQRPDRAVLALIRMGGKAGVQALDFGQPSLKTQLDGDVRSLSFDVAYDPNGGTYKNPAAAGMAMDLLPDAFVAAMKRPGFKAVHVLDVDYNSSCLALADCLKQVAGWSRAHPRHLPLIISLHTNDTKTPMPGATHPVAYDAAAMDALDGEIRAVFRPREIMTPAQVQGRYPSLRIAVMAHNWPKLGAVRGKVIFVLDDDTQKARLYQGHTLFVAAPESSPLASFISISDPGKNARRIADAVRDGFMVITRADDETREARKNNVARRDAAFTSGAQVIQTDFAVPDPRIGPYHVSLADDPKAMCDTSAGFERCVAIRGTPLPLRTAAAF